MLQNNTYLSNIDNERKRLTKVELSITDDAQDVINFLENSNDELTDQIRRANDISEEWNALETNAKIVLGDIESLVSQASQRQDEANDMESKLEKASNDLGMRVEDLPVYQPLVKQATLIDDVIEAGNDLSIDLKQKFGL